MKSKCLLIPEDKSNQSDYLVQLTSCRIINDKREIFVQKCSCVNAVSRKIISSEMPHRNVAIPQGAAPALVPPIVKIFLCYLGTIGYASSGAE